MLPIAPLLCYNHTYFLIASFISCIHRFSSITGPLMPLHWLPIKSCVQFKIGLITYKVYKNKYLAYLDNYVHPYRSIYHTRCSEPARRVLSIPHSYKQILYASVQ